MKRKSPARSGSKRLRVVIADDSIYVRESLSETVQRLSHLELVRLAKDGVEAMQAVRELDPDVLILDMSMPRMKGLEVLRRLKEEGRKCHIIVLSAESRAIYRQKSLELGASEFFEKTQIEELFEALRKLKPAGSIFRRGRGG